MTMLTYTKTDKHFDEHATTDFQRTSKTNATYRKFTHCILSSTVNAREKNEEEKEEED